MGRTAGYASQPKQQTAVATKEKAPVATKEKAPQPARNAQPIGRTADYTSQQNQCTGTTAVSEEMAGQPAQDDSLDMVLARLDQEQEEEEVKETWAALGRTPNEEIEVLDLVLAPMRRLGGKTAIDKANEEA